MRMATVEEGKSTSSVVVAVPVRMARTPKTRVKISFTNEAFDLMCREARRHGWSPSDAVNYMLSELDDWRSGRRKFIERRKQPR